MKCSVKHGRIVVHKNTQVFHMTSRKQTVQGECFMSERQSNLPEHKDRSGWQGRDTRLQWLMWPSTERIGKDIRASSYFFTRRAADVVSAGGLLYHDDRRSPWWASRDGLRHNHIRSDTVMISMNFNSYARLVIFFIISVLFLNTELYILYEC